MVMRFNVFVSVILAQSIWLGTRLNHEVNAFHLFSPPLLMRLDPASQTSQSSANTNDTLEIYVSEEDSEITIQKDENKPVVYFLKTTAPKNYNLNITYCLQDEEWSNEIISVSSLDETHSKGFSINSTEARFTLTIEGVNRGKSDLVICNVSVTTNLSMVIAPLVTAETPETSTNIMTTTSEDQSEVSVDYTKASVAVSIYYSGTLKTISDVIGWIYFAAWSVSFYPQIWENWKRKSVIGLNFDFLSLNVVGFSLYSAYNIGLFFKAFTDIREEYKDRHDTQLIPVKINDVVFGVHAVFACIVTIIQCIIYERGQQKVSNGCRLLLGGIAAFMLATMIAVFAQTKLEWLDFLVYASYVKLGITIIKYMPQAYMNFRRKSTEGWSIGNVLLDFTGGSLSMGQMIMDSYNFDDWSSFFGDFTKFGLGLFSVVFDILFILQHYVCYRHPGVQQEQLLTSNMEEDLLDGHDSNIAESEPRPSSNEQADGNVTNGCTNMAYVAAEVAEVASATSENNQRD